jgi:hypothetical protein
MKKFVSLTLIGLVALIMNANAQRLGDYCQANDDCNSGYCRSGVCRAPGVSIYGSALKEDRVTSLSQRIVSFAQKKRDEQLTLELKSLFAEDIKRRLGKKDTPVVEPAVIEEVEVAVEPISVEPTIEEIRAQLRPLIALDIKNRLHNEVATETPTEGAAETEAPKTEGTPVTNPVVPPTDYAEPGVSWWVWLLVTLCSVGVFVAGYFVVKRVFFKNDDDYTTAKAVTA